eukprot:916812_1
MTFICEVCSGSTEELKHADKIRAEYKNLEDVMRMYQATMRPLSPTRGIAMAKLMVEIDKTEFNGSPACLKCSYCYMQMFYQLAGRSEEFTEFLVSEVRQTIFKDGSEYIDKLRGTTRAFLEQAMREFGSVGAHIRAKHEAELREILKLKNCSNCASLILSLSPKYCASCREAYYCSRKWQKDQWPNHKNACEE